MGEVYNTKSAVLFVVFNRPDTTKKVLEKIRQSKPKRLYIAADAPRPGNSKDQTLCDEVKASFKDIDWDCEVKCKFSDTNLGCRVAMSEAITWFFEHEEEGIILEDDCLPADSFFRFCDEMLEKYRHDTRIRHITGCNLQHGKIWGDASYYFSNMTHVWGWASWRRVWVDYKDLPKYNTPALKEQLGNIFSDPMLVESWLDIFNRLLAGKLNSWGYQLDLVNFFNNGLTIIPNNNLISNIGFHPEATHTINPESIYANVPVTEMGEITHPIFVLPQKQADMMTLTHDFNLIARKSKQNKWHRRLKRWAKRKGLVK
jgi:hypothetical protein